MKFFGTNLTTKYDNIVHKKQHRTVSSIGQKAQILQTTRSSRAFESRLIDKYHGLEVEGPRRPVGGPWGRLWALGPLGQSDFVRIFVGIFQNFCFRNFFGKQISDIFSQKLRIFSGHFHTSRSMIPLLVLEISPRAGLCDERGGQGRGIGYSFQQLDVPDSKTLRYSSL